VAARKEDSPFNEITVNAVTGQVKPMATRPHLSGRPSAKAAASGSP
jgi:hypothetical protein